jgi:hypothetical protein
MLTGCSAVPPIIVEKPVEIIKEVHIPVPRDLLQGCIGKPDELAIGSKNGDLLTNRRQWIEYASCLESKLDSVRRWYGSGN